MSYAQGEENGGGDGQALNEESMGALSGALKGMYLSEDHYAIVDAKPFDLNFSNHT